MSKKILIIRFSSFGDIVQNMSVIEGFHGLFSNSKIDWLVRSEFSELVQLNDKVSRIWSFDRKNGLLGLIKLGLELRKEKYDIVYDAHSNLRSRVICFILGYFLSSSKKIARRPKERIKRLLLFIFKVNKFPNPYRGIVSYRNPLLKWGSGIGEINSQKWSFSKDIIKYQDALCFVPSAAWKMKRWPVEHWKKLISLMDSYKIVLLGGPSDKFCEELVAVAPDRVINLAGKLSLIESCSIVSNAPVVVSADTGLIHVAEVLGVRGISLIGPSAFGFPTRGNIKVMEIELSCRPCSKDGSGNCSQKSWQKCMVEISPNEVANEINNILIPTS